MTLRRRLEAEHSLPDVTPVGAVAEFGDDGDVEGGDAFHFAVDEGTKSSGFGGEDNRDRRELKRRPAAKAGCFVWRDTAR